MSRSLAPRELVMTTPGGVARISLWSPDHDPETAMGEVLDWTNRWSQVLDPEVLAATMWSVVDAAAASMMAATS